VTHLTGLTPSEANDGAIRVLLAGLPELLAQVIGQAMEAEADMRLVGYAHDNWELLQMAAGADVIVLGAATVDPPPGICTHLLAELPQVKILVVDANGTEAMRYWVAVRRAKSTLTTRRRLVTTIRNFAQLDEWA
jgi:hypothetical protein